MGTAHPPTPCLGRSPAGIQPQRGGGPQITGNQEVKNRLGTARPPLAPQHLGGNLKKMALVQDWISSYQEKCHNKHVPQCPMSKGLTFDGTRPTQLYITVPGRGTRGLAHLKALAAGPRLTLLTPTPISADPRPPAEAEPSVPC